jgi:maltose phosphorylase
VAEGVHITSMAGTWMSIVEGYGGKRILDGKLCLYPLIPEQWKEYSFKVIYRGVDVLVTVNSRQVTLEAEGGSISLTIYGKEVELIAGQSMQIATKNSREN